MIDALITGKLVSTPEQRQAGNGNRFTVVRVRVSAGNGEPLFVSAICFDSKVQKLLQALSEGDSACLAGELTPKIWTPKGGEPRIAADLTVHAVLTPYHVKRKRQAMQDEPKAPSQASIPMPAQRMQFADGQDLESDLPWEDSSYG